MLHSSLTVRYPSAFLLPGAGSQPASANRHDCDAPFGGRQNRCPSRSHPQMDHCSPFSCFLPTPARRSSLGRDR